MSKRIKFDEAGGGTEHGWGPVTSPTPDLPLPHPPVNRLTGRCESITYHILWNAVGKIKYVFTQVNSPEKLWNWTNTIFLPTLYMEEWYNGAPTRPDEARVSSNLVSYRLGPPRLRQIRIKPGMSTSDTFL